VPLAASRYSDTAIDPLELIKRYQRRLTPPTPFRKYPTKFLHSEKAETTTNKPPSNDVYPQYTTSASFRKPHDDKNRSGGAALQPSVTYGHKVAAGGRADWWAERQRLQERRQEERREELKRQREEEEEEKTRAEERRAAEKRLEQERAREEAAASSRREDNSRRRTFHTTLVPVRLQKVSVAPTNLILLDGYYRKATAPRKMDYLMERHPVVAKAGPSLGFPQSLDYIEAVVPGRRERRRQRPGLLRAGFGRTLADLLFPGRRPRRGPAEAPRRQDMGRRGEAGFPYKFQRAGEGEAAGRGVDRLLAVPG
jgi:hypothetical protein